MKVREEADYAANVRKSLVSDGLFHSWAVGVSVDETNTIVAQLKIEKKRRCKFYRETRWVQ